MNPEMLNQFIQENPKLVLALLEMLMNMNEQELAQLVQALQQLVQQQGGGGMEGGSPEEEDPYAQANYNLYG
jgi:DNA/RNA-binding domain of Phe-tRNA-synthetase-like protein